MALTRRSRAGILVVLGLILLAACVAHAGEAESDAKVPKIGNRKKDAGDSPSPAPAPGPESESEDEDDDDEKDKEDSKDEEDDDDDEKKGPVRSADVDFDVTKFGAKKGDMKKDSNMALIKAFAKACNAAGKRAKVLVPKGKFLVGEVLLSGPCKSKAPLIFEIQGELKAQPDPSNYMNRAWFLVENVEGLIITGDGALDGQGNEESWSHDDCTAGDVSSAGTEICESSLLPAFWFHRVTNSSIENLKIDSAQGYGVKITESKQINVDGITIMAPKKSKSKDGVYIAESDTVNVANCRIKTGSKCVSTGKSATNVTVSENECEEKY